MREAVAAVAAVASVDWVVQTAALEDVVEREDVARTVGLVSAEGLVEAVVGSRAAGTQVVKARSAEQVRSVAMAAYAVEEEARAAQVAAQGTRSSRR